MNDAMWCSVRRVCVAVAIVVVLALALMASTAFTSHLQVVNTSNLDLTDVQVVIATLNGERVRETHREPVLRAGESLSVWNWRSDSSVGVTWVAIDKQSEFVDYCVDRGARWIIELRSDGSAGRR